MLGVCNSSIINYTFSVINEDQERAGVYKDYIRLSIGIEHENDIILDIENALRVYI